MCVLLNPAAPTASAPPGLFTHLLAQYAQREQAAPLGPAVSGHREVVESQGARVAHHDGGDEQSHERLAPQLHAADVVICQVACISHNAYWRVKEHCKRTGTPCLFLPSASKSSLERALAYWAAPPA
ncbi:MAG: hypothetical protein C0445_00030 [Polaromonas sp.]|nr:hypothetical protein [Polaromonas sp.]